MTMQFLRNNDLNTTTQVIVDSANTATVENIFDIDLKKQWVTDGYASTTSTIFSVEFGTTTVLNKIFLQNHNLKQFRIFYNSATANTFTPAISETTNSETSNYFNISDQTVTSIQFQVDEAQSTSTEKAVGYFYLGTTLLDFERNPTAADYKPQRPRKQVVHDMPNGGVTIFNIQEKFRTEIKWKFVTESFQDSLLGIWDTGSTFFFVPFPTTTAWNGDGFEVAWVGTFDFKHSDNNTEAGYSGRILLREVA